MILQVLAVYDTKARAFANPIAVGHVDLGIRSFAEAANQPGNNINKYAADHLLFHIGTFDDNTGLLEAVNPPLNLGNAAQFLRTEKK